MQEPTADLHAFRPVPKTGVIYVTSEATKLGFSSTDPERALDRVREPAPLISAIRKDVPSRVERAYLRAVDPDPEHRFATAAELAAELEEVIAQLGGVRAAFVSFIARVVSLCGTVEATVDAPAFTTPLSQEGDDVDTLDRPHRRREK